MGAAQETDRKSHHGGSHKKQIENVIIGQIQKQLETVMVTDGDNSGEAKEWAKSKTCRLWAKGKCDYKKEHLYSECPNNPYSRNKGKKIEEKGGLKIKDILCSTNPFPKPKCIQKSCPLCTESKFVEVNTEEIKISCNTNNIGYKWLCLTCKERNIVKVYEGETGRSARTRGAEHLKELEKQKEKGVLYKHKMTDQNESSDNNYVVKMLSRNLKKKTLYNYKSRKHYRQI